MYFPFIDASMLAQMADMNAEGGMTTASGVDEMAYTYQQAMQQYAVMTGATGSAFTEFWFVVKLSTKNFSENLEMHPELPMMLPKEGTGELIGIVRNSDELNRLVEKTSEDHVHLTYKVKIQGKHAFRTLIEFLAEHNMLDQDKPMG